MPLDKELMERLRKRQEKNEESERLRRKYLEKEHAPFERKMVEVVEKMYEKAAQFGDLALPLEKIREYYYNDMKHPDRIQEDRKRAMEVLDIYSKMLDLPWRDDIESYRNTKVPINAESGNPGLLGYVQSGRREMYIRDPSPHVYMHEKGHILQKEKGALHDRYMQILDEMKSTPDKDRWYTPYKERVEENLASQFSLDAERMATAGWADKDSPLLNALKEQHERALNPSMKPRMLR